MSHDNELLKKLYRRAMAVCHPDRAPAHLHSFMEAKAKELNAAYEAGSFARVRKIAEELGVKDIPPMPKSESSPKPQLKSESARQKQKANQQVLDAALFDAAWDEDLVKAKYLLGYGANPNAVDEHGRTILMAVSVDGNVEFVKSLLSAGADPNAVDMWGDSASIYAASLGYRKVVEVLLAAGADPNWENVQGVSASALLKRPFLNAICRIRRKIGKVIERIHLGRRGSPF